MQNVLPIRLIPNRLKWVRWQLKHPETGADLIGQFQVDSRATGPAIEQAIKDHIFEELVVGWDVVGDQARGES